MNTEKNEDRYELSALIWNETFRSWVLAPDSSGDAYWNSWRKEHPKKERILEAARKIVLALHTREPYLSPEEVEYEIQKILASLDEEEAENTPVIPMETATNSRFSWKYAAAVLAIAALGFFIWNNKKSDDSKLTFSPVVSIPQDRMLEEKNMGSTDLVFTLPDSSRVTLKPGAAIRFPAGFEGIEERPVELTGDAFFKVSKNPAKPFRVFSQGLVTQVLGTEFWIRSGAGDENATVEVVSGVVSVYSYSSKTSTLKKAPSKLNELVLTVNQKATFNREDQSLKATIVDEPLVVKQPDNLFYFRNTAADQVFHSLENAYAVDIIFDPKLFENRTFTASLSNETLYEKLDIICKILGARYEVIDGKIVVSADQSPKISK